jgi:hypothetical protein
MLQKFKMFINSMDKDSRFEFYCILSVVGTIFVLSTLEIIMWLMIKI